MKSKNLYLVSVVIVILLIAAYFLAFRPAAENQQIQTTSATMATGNEATTTSQTKVVLTGSAPQESSPYNTTYATQTYTNYGGGQSMVKLPTYYYRFEGAALEVSFSFTGDDQYGHLHFGAVISTTQGRNVATFTATDTPAPEAVYTEGDDIVFVWQSFDRDGISSTPHQEGFIVFDPILGTSVSKAFTQDDGAQPSPLSDFFSFAVKNDNLYCLVTQNGQERLYLIKDGSISEVSAE